MTVFFRPCGDITKAPVPRSNEDTALYEFLAEKTGLPIAHDPEVEVDYEDWIEPACMLEQAIHCGLEIKILPKKNLRHAVMNPLATIPGKACRDMLIGRQLRNDPYDFRFFDFGWPAVGENKANHYAELDTFWRRAGRRIALADMPGDPSAAGDRKTVFSRGLNSTSLNAAMDSFAPGSVIVKQVYPGKELPLLTYDLDKDLIPVEGEYSFEEGGKPTTGKDLFINDVGFHFARYEGDPASLLVQEKITMTHETRFFVIGGKVITGAACIESHTPQQTPHWDDALPPVWEITRNSGEMDERDHISRKRTALKMWQYAWKVAGEITQEAPDLDVYVLDVALDGKGEPLVIELNPASCSGLYANNAIRLFDAIHAYAEQAPARAVEAWDRESFISTGDEPEESFSPPEFDLSTLLDDPFED